jgi:uncharacterized protein (UPF0548 family)
MLSLTRPKEAEIQALVDSQRGKPFSYAEVGATRSVPPPGYNVDTYRIKLGEGEATFERAIAAVRRWEMFNLGWVQMGTHGPIEEGTTVSVLIRVLGLWSLNLCRIVYVVNEESGPVRRFGFAYGTLYEHAERGEERFTVEHHAEDGSVYYDILAFSQPRMLLAKLVYPYTRRLQRRFGASSKQAMALACKQ